MKTYLITLLFIVIPLTVKTQNLVANGGFEEVNVCEEFNAICAPEAWFRIPPTDVNVNTKKVSSIYKGDYSEIIVIENINHPKSYRVFLYTMLLCPLIENEEYILRFYLNPIFQNNYELGILFSKEELITGIINPLDFKSSLTVTGKGNTKKKNQWKPIEVTYKAKGGEKYLTFGNFNTESFTFSKKDKTNNSQGDLIYLIDDINLHPKEVKQNGCDIEASKKILYEANHRHTYKKGIENKVEPIKSLEDTITFLNIEKVNPTISIRNSKKFEITDITFDFDKNTIKPNSRNLLDSILTTIKDFQPKEIEVIGHTDNVGEEEYNLKLSIKRANAVKDYILTKYNGYKGKIISTGKGETELKVDNTTEKNRLKNRRVEIILRR